MIASSTLAGILAIPAGFKVNQRVFFTVLETGIFNVKRSVGVGTGSCFYKSTCMEHILKQNDSAIVIVKIYIKKKTFRGSLFSTHTAHSVPSQRLESVIHNSIAFTLGNETDIVRLNFSTEAFSLRASSPGAALSHPPTPGRASARMLQSLRFGLP